MAGPTGRTETTGPTDSAGRAGPRKRSAGRERTPAARPPADGGAAGSPNSSDGPSSQPDRRLRFRRRAVPLVLVLVAVLGGFGTWALYGSPWLRVERVSVAGTRVLTPGQVRQAARVPAGEPMASVGKSAVERRARAALPRLADIEVVRAWPHGVALHVTERRPELVLRRHRETGKSQESGKAGRYVEVDREGVRFATVADPPKGVPLLVMGSQRNVSLRHFGTTRLRRAAVRVAGDLPESVSRETRTVRVRSYDAITLKLTGGRTVQWGSAERGAAKAKSLTALMKAAKGAEHFDVSVPSAPASSGS